jgi:hypothetical protein
MPNKDYIFFMFLVLHLFLKMGANGVICLHPPIKGITFEGIFLRIYNLKVKKKNLYVIMSRLMEKI